MVPIVYATYIRCCLGCPGSRLGFAWRRGKMGDSLTSDNVFEGSSGKRTKNNTDMCPMPIGFHHPDLGLKKIVCSVYG